MRALLKLFAAAVLVLLAVLLGRALMLPRAPAAEARVAIEIDRDRIARSLAGAIRFPTVSTRDGPADAPAFAGLHAFLERTYPLVHARLVREVIAGESLLFEWRGADPARAPIVLLAHLDVVPALAQAGWKHPPFAGVIEGGFVHGRGALDDKSGVVAILEAVEQLLREDFAPRRSIVLAFGADEEVGGRTGAVRIVERFGARRPLFVLDEGGAILEGQLPGVAGPTAMVGIAEKGYLSLELTASGAGGHSSTPIAPSPLGRIARAVARLEADPFPARLDGATRAMVDTIAPYQSFARKILFANLWLAEPLVVRSLLAAPQSAAVVRTTIAPTILQAGVQDNVVPPGARAVVNLRPLPGDTIEQVLARVRTVIADDAVKIAPIAGADEASPVTDAHGPAFALLAKTIRETLGLTPPMVVPYLTIAATDARHWAAAGTTSVFRFRPFEYERDSLQRMHGVDERIGIDSLAGGVRFYIRLLREAQALP